MVAVISPTSAIIISQTSPVLLSNPSILAFRLLSNPSILAFRLLSNPSILRSIYSRVRFSEAVISSLIMVRKSSLVNSANTGDAKSSSNKTVITFIIDAPPWGGSITANDVIYYHGFIDLSILFSFPAGRARWRRRATTRVAPTT